MHPPPHTADDAQTSEELPSPSASVHFPWLESLSLAKLRLQFEVQEAITTGPFPENRVRSSLGVYLRRQEVCSSTPELDCDRCPMTERCLWFSLFGVPNLTESRPYCLDLNVPGARGGKTGAAVAKLAPGSRVGLDLTLFGAAADQPERLVAALAQPEAGSALFGGRISLVETRVLEPEGGTSPYTVGMPLRTPLRAWLEQPVRKTLENHSRWRITLHTPLSAKLNHGRFLMNGHDLTFPDLVRLAVRRTVQLAEDFGGFQRSECIRQDFQPLEDAAQAVRVVSHALEWQERTRRSARQEQQLTMGGLVGWFELEGALAPFAPLLLAAELCHLGKRATFGFGGIHVRPCPSEPATH